MIAFKSLGWRKILNPLTRQSWTFLTALKYLLMKVYVLLTEASGINAKTKGNSALFIHQFHTISGLTRVKLEETGSSRIITDMVDLK